MPPTPDQGHGAVQAADALPRSTRVDGSNSGLPDKPPVSLGMARFQRRPRDGGVGDDQAFDAAGPHHVGDLVQRVQVQVGRDLEQDGLAHAVRLRRARRVQDCPEAAVSSSRFCRPRRPGVLGEETLTVT